MAPSRTHATPADPYPPTRDFRIIEVRYVDHLKLVRYYARPKGSPPDSNWQLAEDYALEIDIDYRAANGEFRSETWHLTAPQGMYTDLSSVPAFGRWIVSKVGPHLEASIIHDYLYLKWTDERLGRPRITDWIFADAVLRAGIKPLTNFSWFQRFAVNFATGTAGWFVFRAKAERLANLLSVWKPHLGYLPDKPIPPDQRNPSQALSIWTRLYLTVAFLVFVAIAIVGTGQLFAWLGWSEWRAGIAPLVDIAEAFFVGVIGVVGAALVLALAAYAIIRLYIPLRRSV